MLLAPLFLLSYLHGQVVLQDSYATAVPLGAPTQLDGGSGPFGYEINLDPTTDFSAAGHGKLVMVCSGHDGNVPGVPTVSSVTYDGVALTQAIQDTDNGGIVTAGVFYLDNVAGDGTLRIELDSDIVVHYGFGLHAVDGLKPGVQDTGTARDPLSAATVTMTTSEGFFVQESVRNNQSLAGDPDDDFQTLYNHNGDSYRGLSQYQVTSAAGDYLAPINNGGVNFRRVVTAAFEALEDPAAGTDPRIASFAPVGPSLWELTLAGEADTGYRFYSSTTLEFTPGTLIEDLTQSDPNDEGSVGGANDSVLTTDSNGNGKVRISLTGDPADFVRAQTIP